MLRLESVDLNTVPIGIEYLHASWTRSLKLSFNYPSIGKLLPQRQNLVYRFSLKPEVIGSWQAGRCFPATERKQTAILAR